eukprot:CAMPEP_0116104258 /NCGR_PEP_ID=MMETSP0327-20121206/14351_1 /TAXON_ID=44447 /ORGANISM="Pseudo-nitzschia delicatissima, Strain B596" /LENGTH=762 /DNA_ID=CAMNT_0003596481 /DNA_START=115 /DNA_END=2403 /DNA_ORIENTATION=+
MKCLHPSSFRLLPYLLFQASTTFLNTSALLATNGIVTDRASWKTHTGFRTLRFRQDYQFARFNCNLRNDIQDSDSIRRKASSNVHTEDNMLASVNSTSDNLLASSSYTSSTPTLCPKCHGEGKISKAPSKKARLREQRRLYKQQQEQQNEQEDNQSDNHKRIKRTTQTPISTTESSQGETNNNHATNFDEPKLPRLPRRWDPCPKCDQTGLLNPSKNRSSGSSSSAVKVTDRLPHVAIVGGGIGGIALAVALRHRGIPFMVYEKDSRFDQRSQGYGLTLQQARRALQALGIFESSDEPNSSSGSGKLLQDHAVTSTKHVVHTPNGKQVGEWGLRRWLGDSNCSKKGGKSCDRKIVDTAIDNTKNSDNAKASRKTSAKNKKRRQNLHVPRQTLRFALLEALKEASGIGTEEGEDHENLNIAWGHKLISIRPDKDDSKNNLMQLSFEVVDESGTDKRVVNSQANLVVGCDGIRSSVRKQFLPASIGNETEQIKPTSVSTMPLRYLNCVVVLGICPLGDLFPKGAGCEGEESAEQRKLKQTELSPLLDGETVFQTADGTTRIYLMPYSKKNNEYMWQLSFPVPDEEFAIDLSRRGSSALKEEALRRCQSWHVPIPEILKATPIELVSGYPVYDRDILTSDVLSASRRDMSLNTENSGGPGSLPITLLGDAAHPMSPFKGQGANQALLDALSLARSLYRIHCREGRTMEEVLEHYENEMLNRSAEKVRASSAAAQFLHTEVAIQEGDVTRGAAFNSSTSVMDESAV